ncbi:UNVERIFIED_CONTAM: hypothetical protein K2H54_056481 [Gekko kuhli]
MVGHAGPARGATVLQGKGGRVADPCALHLPFPPQWRQQWKGPVPAGDGSEGAKLLRSVPSLAGGVIRWQALDRVPLTSNSGAISENRTVE